MSAECVNVRCSLHVQDRDSQRSYVFCSRSLSMLSSVFKNSLSSFISKACMKFTRYVLHSLPFLFSQYYTSYPEWHMFRYFPDIVCSVTSLKHRDGSIGVVARLWYRQPRRRDSNPCSGKRLSSAPKLSDRLWGPYLVKVVWWRGVPGGEAAGA